ncbi:hypothetical protein AMECASPLE_036453 [Ameca splendens]|uniref:Uncharacterized protein n=1 Tax=Ameca splendens TaxID=208324 RepID=A0ABV0YIR7_9TELE
MNLLTFLYQTELQLSSSSSNGRVEEKTNSSASFCRSRYASPLCRPVRHAGNGNEGLISTGFIIRDDVRAATSVELRMSNCAAQPVYPPKMDEPNIVLFYNHHSLML